MSEGWWDNMSDKSQAAYIKKHGSAPNVAGDDDEKEPSADPGSTWDKHSTKVKATSPEHQKEIDAWMKKYSNPKGGVDWDKAKKDNAPFPKGEPDDPSRSRGRDDVPKEPLARGTKVTASWKGLSGEEQEIPDGEIEDVKYSDSGHEVSYVIRWNNGNNLIELPADKVKGVDDKGEPSAWSQKAQQAKDDLEGLNKWGAAPDEIGDWIEDNKWSLSGGKLGRAADLEFAPVQKAYDELEDAYTAAEEEDDWDAYDKAKEDFSQLANQKLDPQKVSRRTGKELNQETFTIDGKQFRRMSEGVEKQPKPKYEFSEFYKRFKR